MNDIWAPGHINMCRYSRIKSTASSYRRI